MILTPSTGSRHVRTLSVSGYRGPRVADNDKTCTIINSTLEWTEQRTGIQERRWATDEETPLFIVVAAAHRAIDRTGPDPSRIDGTICSAVSHFQQSLSLAIYVAHELGLSAGPVVFDISAACAGFRYRISIVESLVRSGVATNVPVIGVETLGHMVNLEDRITAFLSSDGVGAAIAGPSEEPAIDPVVWGFDGSQAPTIQIQDWANVIDPEQRMSLISMDGCTALRWVTTYIMTEALEAVKMAGITPKELDVFILHQANNQITDPMLCHLKLPENVVASRDIRHMGNLLVASIPLVMEALPESGEAASRQTAPIIGFGAGLAFVGQVVVLP